MCKTIDLHTHSYCSDGTFSPEGLVILAKKQGLSAIALTDHDTIDGLELFLEAGEKHGMETICGIEFAALYEGFHRPEIHIVGLGFDSPDPMLLEKLEEIRQSRDERTDRMAEALTACPFLWKKLPGTPAVKSSPVPILPMCCWKRNSSKTEKKPFPNTSLPAVLVMWNGSSSHQKAVLKPSKTLAVPLFWHILPYTTWT